MKIHTRLLLWLLVSLQCVAICVLTVYIFQHIRASRYSRGVVVPLSSDAYTKRPSSQFPHFFEPKANEQIIDSTPWLPEKVTYTINADSLHERMNYSMMKAPGTFRIITLGDSFTYGLLVNTPENYPEQLEDMLNANVCATAQHFDVINLGVPAYDVGFSAERFRFRGVKYKPDAVVWFMNQFTMSFLADYKTRLENKYVQEITDEEMRAQEKLGVYYYPGVRAFRDMTAQVPQGEIIGKEASYLQNFSALYQGPLIIVANNWSMWNPLAKLAVVNYVMFRPSTWLHRSLPSLESESGLLQDGHPNVRGHRIIASDIRDYLVKHGLLPCGEAK